MKTVYIFLPQIIHAVFSHYNYISGTCIRTFYRFFALGSVVIQTYTKTNTILDEYHNSKLKLLYNHLSFKFYMKAIGLYRICRLTAHGKAEFCSARCSFAPKWSAIITWDSKKNENTKMKKM